MSGEGDEARYGAMIEFLSSFPTLSGEAPTDLAELGDGVVLFEALSEIAPNHFDASTIARDLGDNWALKSSNLRKLIRNLETYYHEVLHKDADFDDMVGSVPGMTRHSDREAIAGLFELIAAAAVTCEDRGEFVGRIMSMSDVHQIQMKGIIESAMSRLSNYDDDDESDDEGEEPEVVFDSDDDGLAEEEDAMHEMTGMDDNLFTSMDGMMELDGTTVSSDYTSVSPSAAMSAVVRERDELRRSLQDARREFAAHKSQAAMMAEDTENAQKKLRALAEDLQERLGRRQEELTVTENELKKTKRALEDAEAKSSDLEEKYAMMADDLDVATAKAAQLRKAEATVVAYRKKLEGVGVMNQQMTDLEDQSASYLRQIMDLESDVKKIPEMQRLIDELQTKLAKVETENVESDETLHIKAAELSKLKSDLKAAESAKKMYQEELNELRAMQEGDKTDSDYGSPIQGLSLTSAQSVSETREKALRLDIENKSLKEKLKEMEEKHKQSEESAASTAGLSEDTKQARAEVTRLKDELKKKEAEKEKLGSDKEKLEAYTKKTLSKFQEKYLVALQECKAKLKEKHDRIEALEMRIASEKSLQKREERLLSSTVYELGLSIMQMRLKHT